MSRLSAPTGQPPRPRRQAYVHYDSGADRASPARTSPTAATIASQSRPLRLPSRIRHPLRPDALMTRPSRLCQRSHRQRGTAQIPFGLTIAERTAQRPAEADRKTQSGPHTARRWRPKSLRINPGPTAAGYDAIRTAQTKTPQVHSPRGRLPEVSRNARRLTLCRIRSS